MYHIIVRVDDTTVLELWKRYSQLEEVHEYVCPSCTVLPSLAIRWLTTDWYLLQSTAADASFQA
jgi:hypothetical protein